MTHTFTRLTTIVAALFLQTAFAEVSVEEGKTIRIDIPVKTDFDCNVQVFRGSDKRDIKISKNTNSGVYEFDGKALGSEEIRWEGKMKFRGLKTLAGCSGSGSMMVRTTENAASLAAAEAKNKALQAAKEEEAARLAAEAKLKEQQAKMAELEAKLKAAEEAAAKTPEERAMELKLAAEAKAKAEAQAALEAKQQAEAKAKAVAIAKAKAEEAAKKKAEAAALAKAKAEMEAKKRAEAEAKAAAARKQAQRQFAQKSKLLSPDSAGFDKLNPLERYYLSKDKEHYYDMQDNGGLQGAFFGLSVFSFASQGKSLFVDTISPPKTIRDWASNLCGITKKDWEIQRFGTFSSGKATGVYCDVTYQPLSERQKTWTLSLTWGPKQFPAR